MKKIFALAAIIILTGFGCGIKSPDPTPQSDDPQYSTSTSVKSQTTTTTIMIPEDIEKYRTEMTNFIQAGGTNPIKNTVFVKKEVTIPYVPYSTHIMTATVETAVNTVYKAGGGPEKITVDYLEVKDAVAYVQLNIDTNGWAGVSITQAIIRPIVAKNLGQFPGITKVTFGQIPVVK